MIKNFPVIHEANLEKTNTLLSGTFHEIKDRIRIITPQKISELFHQKKRWRDLEKEIVLL